MSSSHLPGLKKIVLNGLFVLITLWIGIALVFGLTWHLSRYVWKTLNPSHYNYTEDATWHLNRFGIRLSQKQQVLGFNTGYNPIFWAMFDSIKGPPFAKRGKIGKVQLTAQIFRVNKVRDKIETWENSLHRYCQERSSYLACETRPSTPYESIKNVFFGIGIGSQNGTLITIKLKDIQAPVYFFWFDETKDIALLKTVYDEMEFGRTDNYASGRTREWIEENP